jgi:hypothetical protein
LGDVAMAISEHSQIDGLVLIALFATLWLGSVLPVHRRPDLTSRRRGPIPFHQAGARHG